MRVAYLDTLLFRFGFFRLNGPLSKLNLAESLSLFMLKEILELSELSFVALEGPDFFSSKFESFSASFPRVFRFLLVFLTLIFGNTTLRMKKRGQV